MIDGENYTGEFWLPSNPNNKIRGTITYSKFEGIKITLGGLFDWQTIPEITQKHIFYELLLGHTDQGLITLYDCKLTLKMSYYNDGSTPTTNNWPFNKTYITQYGWATLGFTQVLFQNVNSIKFSVLSLSYTFLKDWADFYSYPTAKQTEGKNNPKLPEAFILNLKTPDVIANTAKGKIFFSVSLKSNELLFYINFELEQDQPLDFWMKEIIKPIQNLISFATNRPNFLEDVVGYSSNNIINNDPNFKVPTISIMLPPRFYNSDERLRNSYRFQERLFGILANKEDFQGILDRWFILSKELELIIDIYIGVLFNMYSSTEQQFLSLAHTAESYHTERFNNLFLPEKEYNFRKELILESVPADYKEWIEPKLSNSKSLKLKIVELMDYIDSTIGNNVVEDNNNFANIVRETRNYLTHHNITKKGKAARGLDLINVTDTLKFVIQVCLLKELGLPFENLKRTFFENRIIMTHLLPAIDL